jgi:hypothetical protein
VIGPLFHGTYSHFDFAQGRDHDYFDEAIVLPDDAEHFQATDSRQLDVEQHQVDVLALQDRQPLFTGRRVQDAIALLQDRGQRVPHSLVVVDDEHRFAFCAHGLKRPREDCRLGSSVKARCEPAASAFEDSWFYGWDLEG